MIFSVDTDSCPQEYENVERCGLCAGHVLRLLGRSQDIGPTFPLTCDLLFVDGDHWDAGGDLGAWVDSGKVKPGGVVALHDYQPVCAPNNPGSVYQDVTAWEKSHADYARAGLVERIIAFRVP